MRKKNVGGCASVRKTASSLRQACAVTAGAAVGLIDRQDGPSLRQADTARDVWHIAPLPRFQTATGCHSFRAAGITY
jgi:hypothetical protein